MPLNSIFHSFYAKLSALFLLLMLGLGLIMLYIGVQAAQRYTDEVEQKLNRTLAADLAPRFEPLLSDSIDQTGIREQIRDLTGINRRIEIYLLDERGTIKASFLTADMDVAQPAVRTAPIRDYMRGEDLPILGDDPLHEGVEKPFSVAPITIMGQQHCYLYIVLGSDQFASVARMIGDSYIARITLYGFAIALLATAGLGLVLFRRLTWRIHDMYEVVSEFERGDFRRRMTPQSNDEIGELARCFNRMADTLMSTMAELKEADHLRRQLVANVSHDLRSPLASVQGYLETVVMKGEELDPARRQRYLTTALRNAERLNHLVTELFDLSKLESRQVEPSVEVFPLAELVQDIVMQYAPQAEARSVDLHASFPERLARVQGDIGLIERALSNLIDNALHYTPPGGQVHVRLTNGEDEVEVSVQDTGPGIPADDLPYIFERFYRVDKSRERHSGGAGLGLAIAKEILELHGSMLEVESTVGEGTRFYFALPVAEAEPVA